MPNRNSSGRSSSGRRGPSRNSGKSFSKGKSEERSSGRPIKKDGDKPFRKESKSYGGKREGSSSRPYKRFDKPSQRNGDDSRGSGGYKKRGDSYSGSSRSNSSSRPFKKFEKPSGRGGDDSRGGFKKFDKPGGRDDSRGSGGYKKRGEGFSGPSRSNSTSRPYKKFDKSSDRGRDSRSGFKKFDKPSDDGDARKRGAFRKRGDSYSGSSESNSERKSYKSDKPFGRRGKDEGSFAPRRDERKEFERRPRRSESSDQDKPRRSSNRGSFDKDDSTGRKGFFDKQRTEGGRERSSQNKQPDTQAPPQTTQIRLNRYIANSGVCSRREADELITMGLITVNGKTVTEMGYKVNPGDEVRHEGKLLKAEKPVYILLNKPKGFLTTTDDPQERKTIMHIIGSAVKERVYPVGRLDRNTTGLLLITNDGELADKLMHPSYNVKKIYKVELDKPLTKADSQAILDGVQLEEGKATVDDLAIVSDDGRTVGVELHIGWNRVVRRIFETLGYEVVKLDRSVYAGLDKKELSRGQWRFLTKEEIVRLKHFK